MAKSPHLDLVLVNCGNRTQVYQTLGNEMAAIEPPVWAGLMATYVRLKGYNVAIVDASAEQLTPEHTAARVKELGARLTAIVIYGQQPSASTQNMPAASRCARAIKQTAPNLPLLMIGGHVASLPEQTLREESADFVCDGEGLATLTSLLEALTSTFPHYDKIPDLWYRSEAGFCRSSVTQPLVLNLDAEMPGIAWDLLPMPLYRAHNWHCFGDLKRQPYASMYTTLGCPYRCAFCCIHAPFKMGEKALGMKQSVNSYRLWSVKRIVDDLELLVSKYGVRNVKFADELFVLNASHVEGICDGIIERGLDLNVWAYARVDTVRNGMIEKLRQAGIGWLAFGVEAANSRVRGDVQKGYGQERIFETINRCRQTGINVIANFIFGLPEDDLQTMQETLNLALDLNAEFANFYCAMAYPGSQLYNTAVTEGWPLPQAWTGYSQHSIDTLPLPTKHVPAAEVLRFRDRAFQLYFNDDRYLNMIQKKFGQATVQHIREMTRHKLERRYA